MIEVFFSIMVFVNGAWIGLDRHLNESYYKPYVVESMEACKEKAERMLPTKPYSIPWDAKVQCIKLKDGAEVEVVEHFE